MGKYEDADPQGYETHRGARPPNSPSSRPRSSSSPQEVEKLKTDLETKAVAQKAQLAETRERPSRDAEDSIPDRPARRSTAASSSQRGADALAAVDADSRPASAATLAVTTQMLNELINRRRLAFCKSCGRILYLAEDEAENSRASGEPKGKAKG